jgi:hypothetical protein
VVVHDYNPSTLGTDERRSLVSGQLKLKTLSQIKNKNKQQQKNPKQINTKCELVIISLLSLYELKQRDPYANLC